MDGEQIRILRRIAKDDDAAMSDLFDTYAPGVKQYAYRQLRNHADADDVTQLVFTRLYFRAKENSELHKDYKSLEHLIHSIASGIAGDIVRARRVDEAHESVLLQLPVARPRRPDEILLGKELVQVVRQTVDELPEASRETADLVILRQHTMEEVSILTEASVDTVKSRMRRSRQRLITVVRSYLKKGTTHEIRILSGARSRYGTRLTARQEKDRLHDAGRTRAPLARANHRLTRGRHAPHRRDGAVRADVSGGDASAAVHAIRDEHSEASTAAPQAEE